MPLEASLFVVFFNNKQNAHGCICSANTKIKVVKQTTREASLPPRLGLSLQARLNLHSSITAAIKIEHCAD